MKARRNTTKHILDKGRSTRSEVADLFFSYSAYSAYPCLCCFIIPYFINDMSLIPSNLCFTANSIKPHVQRLHP